MFLSPPPPPPVPRPPVSAADEDNDVAADPDPMERASQATFDSSSRMDFFLAHPSPENQAIGRCLVRNTSVNTTPFFTAPTAAETAAERTTQTRKRVRGCPSDVPSGVSDFHVIHRLRLRTEDVMSNG